MGKGKTYRIAELVVRLQRGETVFIKNAAFEWGVSERTVERDVEDLQKTGLMDIFRKNGQIFNQSTKENYISNSLIEFTEKQKKILIILLNLGEKHLLEIMGKDLNECRRKILSSIRRSNYSTSFEENIDYYHFLHPRKDKISLEIVEELETAMCNRNQIKVSYLLPKTKEKINITLAPYRLVYANDHWYLFARDLEREFTAFWKVSRIRDITIEKASFFELPEIEKIEYELSTVWTHHYTERKYDMEVRFAPEIAMKVVDTERNPGEKFTQNKDGSYNYEVTVCGWREFMWWLLIWGDKAELLKPEWMREKISEYTLQIHKKYVQKSDENTPT